MSKKVAATCPICKQAFEVPERLFYSVEFCESRGLYHKPSDRAIYLHKVDGKYCGSNGVVRLEATGDE